MFQQETADESTLSQAWKEDQAGRKYRQKKEVMYGNGYSSALVLFESDGRSLLLIWSWLDELVI